MSPGELPLADLTPRQREVAELVAHDDKLTRHQIAARLLHCDGKPISPRTVDAHVQAIANRLGEDDLPALRRVRLWARKQLGLD